MPKQRKGAVSGGEFAFRLVAYVVVFKMLARSIMSVLAGCGSLVLPMSFQTRRQSHATWRYQITSAYGLRCQVALCRSGGGILCRHVLRGCKVDW